MISLGEIIAPGISNISAVFDDAEADGEARGLANNIIIALNGLNRGCHVRAAVARQQRNRRELNVPLSGHSPKYRPS